jgi:outer membrane lipoprotein-sorting protein
MVLMVNNINRTNFGEEAVTCYTCHRGDRRPKMVPSLTVQYGVPMDDPNELDIFPDPGAPPADQILDRYIAALGGAQRLAGLTSFVAKGTYAGYDTDHTEVPVEVFAKAPGQRTTIVHLFEGNDSVRTFDGNSAWIASADRPVPLMMLTGGNLEGARLDALLSFPARIKELFSQWKVATTVIDDREVQVVQGTNRGQSPVNFYFDESGLLMRLVRVTPTSVGQVPTEISFSDYREVAGVKMPFQWTTTWTNGQTTTKLSEVQPNVAIDAARLARPAPARLRQ